MGKARVGVSGWSYDEWDPGFYPEGLSDDERLGYAASIFDTIEINGTFYSLTDPQTCRRWRDSAPRGFVYAVKGSRYITHMKRLVDAETALANFFASGILELEETLGPILWQLPSNLRFDPVALDSFLGLLPHDTSQAVRTARGHDDRIENAAFGGSDTHLIRHVLEVRNESFLQAETARIARRHGVALCISQSSEWPLIEEMTAGFVYVRLHGPGKLYASEYAPSDLDHWADRIETWRRGAEPSHAHRISDLEAPDRKERDVYVYFDNTAHGYAPRQALALRDSLSTR
jgi:uncharacterized protein YecE (DUF72 family)